MGLQHMWEFHCWVLHIVCTQRYTERQSSVIPCLCAPRGQSVHQKMSAKVSSRKSKNRGSSRNRGSSGASHSQRSSQKLDKSSDKGGLLEHQKYFHGLLPREDIATLLKKNGDFVVRISDEKTVLSVQWDKKPLHYVITTNEKGKYTIDGRLQFESIVEMIAYFLGSKERLSKNSNAQITRPIPRQQWQLAHDQINLVQKIGEGEFGEVYKAYLRSGAGKDTRFQEVAVKLCRTNPDQEQRLKFMTEARLMRIYDHPNIIRFIGVAAQEPPLMIILELAPNGSLLGYLKKKGVNTSLEERIRFCLEAAQGMEFLEKQKCIHQDLAARNCLLSKTNSVKISDFGLSKQQETYKLREKRKVPIKWLAPEVLTNNLYSIKSDVWAFGILMWEVYSDGKTPYPGMKNMEALKKVTAEKYRMETPIGMPPKAAKLMQSTWSEDKDRRPNFNEIKKELAKIHKELKKCYK